MADSRAEDASVAPRRTLASPGERERPVLPPLPEELQRQKAEEELHRQKAEEARRRDADTGSGPDEAPTATHKAVGTGRAAGNRPAQPRPVERPVRERRVKASSQRRSIRKARLRLVQVDAWSVMKTAFLLSIAIGIITVVAVAVVWGVLGAAGVWDSINSMVQQTLGSDNSATFHIQDYIGTSRVLGLTMIVAVIDVILITAISTLGAFVYNLAAVLVGGIEVTLAEDM